MRIKDEDEYGTYNIVNQDESTTVKQPNAMDVDIQRNYKKYSLAMFLCGLINNTGYVLVATSAQSIAKSFEKQDLMSAFNFSLIFLSMGVVAINAKLFIQVKHKIRIYIAILLTAISFIIIGMCTAQPASESWAFWVALLGTTLCGCMQAFGETTMLGYCKNFSSQLIGFWSSGTGFAGIFGSGYYLLLKAMKFEELYIFVSTIPFLLVYLGSFTWLERKRSTIQSQLLQTDINNNDQQSEQQDEDTNNLQMTWENTKLVVSLAWKLSLNLGLVYFFEYHCLTSWADRSNQDDESTDFFNKNAFAILSFCYQIGVFVSRSSLELIKIPKVWILTLLQASMLFIIYLQKVNWLVWGCIAIGFYYDIFSTPLLFQFTFMVWVGLMGGGSYVNVNYLIVSGSVLPQNCKELCMNFNSIVNNFGIMSATLLALAISNFWMN